MLNNYLYVFNTIWELNLTHWMDWGKLRHVVDDAVQAKLTALRRARPNLLWRDEVLVLAAGGKTTYLSEVSAGDKLVVASTDGSTREATVGRAKVEPRPCVQVDLQQGGSIFLQQAETVRLAGVAGPLPVTRAQVGDVVLVRPDDKGTHVGQRISVPVDER